MNDPSLQTTSGVVGDIFAHRFVLRTDNGAILADLGPKGAAMIDLKAGDYVTVEGEQKPSELTVRRLKRGSESFALPHGEKHRHESDDADPAIAKRAAAEAGLRLVGEPRRKPKHFEVLGRDENGKLVELHVDLDGQVRKRRAADLNESQSSGVPASA